MNELLIRNGHVLDPKTGLDEICDVRIQGNRITEVAKGIQVQGAQIIDATGCYVMPGLIDLHVHLRDPGLTHKETLTSGGQAAARGGVTTVCAMPNTRPVVDTPQMVEQVHQRARQELPVHVIQLGSITKGQVGAELVDVAGMAKAGCHALSEDGKSVMNSASYRKAMLQAKEHGLAIFAHCEDIDLVEGGVMNEGARAKELGLKGISNTVEDVIVARDLLLAKETGVQLHLCHCSTADSVWMVERAKKAGISVTAEVCPHHFILTDEDITEDHGRYKMNPPLRSKEDVKALKEGLASGIIDVIATDHAPHAASEKDISMKEAAFGIVGLETSAALTYTELVCKNILTPLQMADRMSYQPSKILGLEDKGSISEGMLADCMIFNPRYAGKIDANSFVSKGKNTPFDGYPIQGKVACTIVDGKVVFEDFSI
jgi:dihydroorotase